MTSNIRARSITHQKTLGFKSNLKAEESEKQENDSIREDVMEELKKMFRPEFLNRVDDIIVFSRLSEEEIKEIARVMLKSLVKRLEQSDIKAEFDDSAVSLLAKEGFDPVYGARPLRRAIQNKVEDLFAEEMLDMKISKGDSVMVSAEDGKIVISKN